MELTEIDVGSGYRDSQVYKDIVGLVLREARDVGEDDERVRR